MSMIENWYKNNYTYSHTLNTAIYIVQNIYFIQVFFQKGSFMIIISSLNMIIYKLFLQDENINKT